MRLKRHERSMCRMDHKYSLDGDISKTKQVSSVILSVHCSEHAALLQMQNVQEIRLNSV